MLEDLRLLDAAKDQYALEFNKKGTQAADLADLLPYIKKTTPLYTRVGKDLFGAAYIPGTVDGPTYAAADTYTAFSDLGLPTEFWAGFKP